MEFGQITQGLRADVLAQASSQGINVSQLMQSGVSFADIMLMIVQNQQGLIDASGIENNAAMPQMADMQNSSENPQELMQNLMDLSGKPMQSLNIQQVVNLLQENTESVNNQFSQNGLNIQNAEELPQEENLQTPVIENQKTETVQKPIAETPKAENVHTPIAEMPKAENVQKPIVEMPKAEMQNPIAEMPKAENVHTPIAEMPKAENVQISVEEMPKSENVQKPIAEMPKAENVQISVEEMPKAENVQKPIAEMPKTENVQNPIAEMPKAENVQIPVEEMPKTENEQIPVEEMPKTENVQTLVAEMPKAENVQKPSSEILHIENSMEASNELYIDNISNKIPVSAPENTGRNNETSGFWQLNTNQNVNISEYYAQMQNLSDLNTVDTQAQDNIRNLMGFISPEIMKVAEKTPSSDGNSFVMDLLSELSSEKEVKDSFDFSESMLKVDPTQLAGLLEFVGTGNSIPNVSDISANEIFKGIENVSDTAKSNGKITFNPHEMIKSGEMEIVSYVSAEKNAENAQSELFRHNQQTAEKSIDLARTMKSVKENVVSEISDETETSNPVSASMTGVNPDDFAHKVDISFERAFAELEMNKAKYGTPDQQLSKGIYENLEKGKSEFTVRLRPEGLGEILVKLVSEEGGKAVLSMIASSEKTAELLNRDLVALQNTLNQHNVEIENNTVKTTETVMHAQSAFDQYDERRQDEANQQNHFRQLKNKIRNVSDKNVSFDSETEPIKSVSDDSALNITI
ncbi:MAG: flagellar hook-length control protein FliK [Oscillospiraceae bacterium]|nr:flagellar hook-length control protein FliK [Oscillospiraceae bacterium]